MTELSKPRYASPGGDEEEDSSGLGTDHQENPPPEEAAQDEEETATTDGVLSGSGLVALMPADGIFLLLVPLRQMMYRSELLSARPVKELCFLVNVPKKACIVGHVANYLCAKMGEQRQDGRPVWTFPFTMFVQREDGEFLPLHKRFNMDQLTGLYPFAYKVRDNMLLLHYTHGFEMPLLVSEMATAVE